MTVEQWLMRGRGINERIKALKLCGEDVTKLVDLRNEIMSAIEKVKDDELASLLIRRYIVGQHWRVIATEMNCSMRKIFRMKKLAVNAIEWHIQKMLK